MSEKLTYTVDEVAALLGVNKKGIYDQIREQNFPHVKVGKRILIPQCALQRWLEAAGDNAA